MKKIVKLIVMFSLLSTFLQSTALSENPLDSNWRDYFQKDLYGISDRINSILIDESGIFIGGNFSWDLRGRYLNGLCTWSDSIWNPIGAYPDIGVNGLIYSIFKRGDTLFVGGIFDSSGTIFVNNIVCWDLTSATYTQTNLGNGVFSSYTSGTVTFSLGVVNSIVGNDSLIFVAGGFDTAGTVGVNNLASWDGTFWSDVGGGTDGIINDLILDRNQLFVCGYFDTVGTIRAQNIAVYDISSQTWSTIGDSINGEIECMLKVDSLLYIAGLFDEVYLNSSTFSVENIVAWNLNSNTWSVLNEGVNGRINCIDGDTNKIFVGGNFTLAGEDTVNYIAEYSSNSWTSLGSGLDSPAIDLIYYNNMLYVAGMFEITGDKVSNYVGLWSLTPLPPPNPYPPTMKDKEEILDNKQVEIIAYPNPFSEITTIELTIKKSTEISIEIVDINGNSIRMLVNGKYLENGKYSYIWNNKEYSQGIYFCKVISESKIYMQKILLIK